MPRLQANALLLLAALIWGSAFVDQAWGMDRMGPLTFTGLRFVPGAAVVAPLAWREWQSMVAAGNPPGGGLGGDLKKQTPGRPTCFFSPSGGRAPQGGGLGGDLQRQVPHWATGWARPAWPAAR